jgi:hypothetical protein
MASIDIVLVYPIPSNDSPVKLTPLSILHPGMMFEAQGKRVAYWDERYDSPEMLDELTRVSEEIGVSAFTGYQCGRAAAILKRAKRLNPRIVTNIGGHHARTCPEQVGAEPLVDRVWPGTSYGETLFPYKPHTRKFFARGDMQYFTSRGCPYICSFCVLTAPWEPKPIQEINTELKTIHHDIGFTEISFSDPNIAVGAWRENGKIERIDRAKRLRQIGDVLRPLGVRWDGNIRSDYVTPEVADALVYSQCYSLEFGCESGNDRYLKDVMHKGHGVKAIRQACLNMRGMGISVMYSFIHGAPHETPEQFLDTMNLIDWIVGTDPLARVSVYEYAPYPGCPLYEDAVAGRGYSPRFVPPETMEGWGKLRLMRGPIYWIAGLNFRMDNTRKNFPDDKWQLIQPYVELARQKWAARDVVDFPCEEVEVLIAREVTKSDRCLNPSASISPLARVL